MKILGINHDMYISSAAIVDDGKIIAASPEERFTRAKQTRLFTKNAIEFCLKDASLSIQDIDAIANAYNPAVHLQNFNPTFSNHRRFRGDYLYSIQDHLFGLLKNRDTIECERLNT